MGGNKVSQIFLWHLTKKLSKIAKKAIFGIPTWNNLGKHFSSMPAEPQNTIFPSASLISGLDPSTSSFGLRSG